MVTVVWPNAYCESKFSRGLANKHNTARIPIRWLRIHAMSDYEFGLKSYPFVTLKSITCILRQSVKQHYWRMRLTTCKVCVTYDLILIIICSTYFYVILFHIIFKLLHIFCFKVFERIPLIWDETCSLHGNQRVFDSRNLSVREDICSVKVSVYVRTIEVGRRGRRSDSRVGRLTRRRVGGSGATGHATGLLRIGVVGSAVRSAASRRKRPQVLTDLHQKPHSESLSERTPAIE